MAGYHSALIAGWVPCGIGFSFSERSLEILGGIQIPCLSLAAFKARTRQRVHGLLRSLLVSTLNRRASTVPLARWMRC